MKKILFVILAVFLCQFVFSQKPLFLKGDKVLNIGIGYDYYPLGALSLDYCVADGILEEGSFGVGPFLAGGFTSSRSIVSIGARASIHYPFFEKFDTYAGVGLGIGYHMWFEFNDKVHLVPALFLGMRYPFSEKLSGFVEAGFGLSYFSMGVALNL
jgi:hypothetical protein